jgi:nifR3 family TIM-barrel protein
MEKWNIGIVGLKSKESADGCFLCFAQSSIIPSFQYSNEDRVNIGSLQLNNPLILAPLAGVSDYPFRRLTREMGCGLAFTGLMNAEGLLRKKEGYLRIEKDDHPISVQLVGSDPQVLMNAAQWAEEKGADAIDINMGCPVSQVIGIGAGIGLMRFPEKVKRILVEVRRGVRCPLTIKIRSGWDAEHINAVEISKIAEDCGVDAITVHPRTKVQGFHGRADWNVIREVKKAVPISVIGNGDVTTPLLAKKMMDETGCDGVMIGRGAFGNPWIFSERKPIPFPSLKEKKKVIEQHFLLLETHYGKKEATGKIKRHVAWYTKGLPASASFRLKLSALKEKEALFGAIASYFAFIERSNACPSLPLAKDR